MTTFQDSVQYMSEKFTAGAAALVETPGSVKHRLLNSYRSQVVRAESPGSDLPDGLVARIMALHNKMLSGQEGPDGAIAEAVDKMTEDEAADLASEIFWIHTELVRIDEARHHTS